ncbi:MAG: hypothetical protein JJT93_03580 [Gammaproteobacteria bacterium]|nr:hypothetical protein [Gammaproteobacteria bacterium]TVQ50541.1 MAG: hypothetical protein EA371_00340 [Gammaproteobacteria bacterium]
MMAVAPQAAPKRTALALAALLALAGCGTGEPEIADAGLLPAEPEARALHCYLVLTLTIDQLTQFEGTGPQDGFLARRSTEELRQARNRTAADLPEGLLADLRRQPGPWLDELLEGFDQDGDGALVTREEVETFNAHVAACSRYRSAP